MAISDYAQEVTASIMNDAEDTEEAIYFVYDSGDRMKNDGYSLRDLLKYYGDLLGAIELRLIALDANPNPTPAAKNNLAKLKAAEAAAQKRLLSIQEELS